MSDEILDDERKKPVKKVNRYLPAYILLALLGVGFLFKNMHWPGSGLIILVSLSLLASYAACSIYYYYKNDWISNIGFAAFIVITLRYILTNFIDLGWYVAGGVFTAGFIVFFFLAKRW
ncbi:MAG: hypothetical protein ACOZCO_09275 [Bacteroidota bacterium]